MALQKRVAKKYPFKDYSQNGTLSLEKAKKSGYEKISQEEIGLPCSARD